MQEGAQIEKKERAKWRRNGDEDARGRWERNGEGGREMGAEKAEKNSPPPPLYARTLRIERKE